MNWFSWEIEIQRHKHKLYERAERYISLEVPPVERQVKVLRGYQRLLIYLGAQMVNWGCRLQTRYNRLAISTEPFVKAGSTTPCS